MKEGTKTGDVVGRPSGRWLFLGDPGAIFFCGKLGTGTKKERGAKKKENGGLWKLTPLMEIRSQRGFPQRLGKHKTLSTVPTRPDGGSAKGLDSPAGWGQIKRSKGAKSS
jgi:hypothetical protein